ncbi:MAG: hypothetical protein Q8O12_00160 [Candidatus Omnitrophota bacterium]|nr:hypothetical protein [Candidatus Omnitrophota bacterium]
MMLRAGKTGKNKGFLLLEILISVSILSFGVILILNSFIGPIMASQLSRDYFNAGSLLEEKMLELHSGKEVEEGSSKGGFSGPEAKFSWDLNVVKLEEISCKEVSMKILWKQKNKGQDFSILTYI